MDGIKGELSVSCTLFLFWNGLTKLKCRYFNLFFLLCFPTSLSTHLYELEVSSLLIQDWYHENTPVLRVCRDTDHTKYWCAPLQVWLCRPLPCAWRIYISSKKKNLCPCSPIGKMVSFSTFLPQMLACGCLVLNIASDQQYTAGTAYNQLPHQEEMKQPQWVFLTLSFSLPTWLFWASFWAKTGLTSHLLPLQLKIPLAAVWSTNTLVEGSRRRERSSWGNTILVHRQNPAHLNYSFLTGAFRKTPHNWSWLSTAARNQSL